MAAAIEADWGGTRECYIVAGQKGRPSRVRERQRPPRMRKLKGKRGRGTGSDGKNPILGLAARGGQVCLKVVDNVRRKTVRPIIEATVAKGSTMRTDGYNIYGKLPEWGHFHKVADHGEGEYARDRDGDGHCGVHCNTVEGLWSLLRGWLRPHRGAGPFYVGFFEWVHNLRKRGISETLELLLKPDIRTYKECILSVQSL